MTSERFPKLVRLLKELFQLDKPELDFGFYRIMHARSAEVTRFLEEDLKAEVQAALGEYGSAERDQVERELREATAQAKSLGVDPDSADKVHELRAKLNEADDLAAVEADVYDHLYRFFRRYYKDGDFISQRVYKDGAYAIPYSGEEVKLHWANADQYYIKTDEYLRNYSFRLRPDDPADPMRVHLRLADAAEGEHDNVKAAEGKKRVFILADGDFAFEEAGENGARDLVLLFEYRPATLDDWPEAQRPGKKKPPAQKPLIELAESRIGSLSLPQPSLHRWVAALEQNHLKAGGDTSKKSRLRAHLERYTARNTFDYFIHKNLGGFLRRELDFYIKNEVMRLDDIENADAPKAEQYLSRIRAIRRSALPVIDFLASLENFQKRLWLKKKFVVETSYCIRLGCIPDEFLPEIAANEAQRREWVELCGIDAIKGDLATAGYSEPLTVEFLRSQPTLMMESRHFPATLPLQISDAQHDRPVEPKAAERDQANGLLLQADNFHGVATLARSYAGRLAGIYIDPPYNTASSAILYKNDYKASSWLTLIASRTSLAAKLLGSDGMLCCAIDDQQVSQIRMFLQSLFPIELGTVVVRSNPAGRKSKGQFSPAHEFALFFGNATALPGPLKKSAKETARYPHIDERGRYAWNNLIRHGSNDRRRDRPKQFYPIFIAPDDSIRVPPLKWNTGQRQYRVLEDPRDQEAVVWPTRMEGGQLVEKNWHVGPERIAKDPPDRYRVRRLRDTFGAISTKIAVDFKIYMDEFAMPKTWWEDPKYASANRGAHLVKALFGAKVFSFPKASDLVEDCIRAMNPARDSTILDYFAGSGTTGQAVINLNRGDGGDRRFVLVEMGEHFETVLLPRLKKVTYSPEWKDGKPVRQATAEEAERSPRIMKVIRLESYEDTLNNLDVPTAEAGSVNDQTLPPPPPPPKISGSETSSSPQREQYLLRYLLDVDTRHDASLLDVERFIDPTAYALKIKRPGSDESRETPVDLIETFNWLLGLRVSRLWAPRQIDARFERDGEGRLTLKDGLRETPDGQWWFRAVEGLLPDDRRALVIWRKRPGGDTTEGIEQDNLVLNEWFKAQGWAERSEGDGTSPDVVYANGDHNLRNVRPTGATWEAHLLEDHFFRLMFEDDEPSPRAG